MNLESIYIFTQRYKKTFENNIYTMIAIDQSQFIQILFPSFISFKSATKLAIDNNIQQQKLNNSIVDLFLYLILSLWSSSSSSICSTISNNNNNSSSSSNSQKNCSIENILSFGQFYCFYHYQNDDSVINRYQQSISKSNYPSTDFFVMDYFYFDYYYFIKKWNFIWKTNR